MMRAMRQAALLAGKDLRIEASTRRTAGLVVVLGVLAVVVLGAGLGAERRGAAPAAALWVAYLFSGVLCFEKTMAVERLDGAMAALLMAPVGRGAIYAAKLIANLLLMLCVAAVITAAGVLFLGFDLSAAPGQFALITLMGMTGFAAIGTLLAAATGSSRLEGGLLALTAFPLALPLVMLCAQLTLRVFRDGVPCEAGDYAMLAAFDAVFVTAGWLLFEWVVEP